MRPVTLTWIGLTILAVALLVGFMPVSTEGVNCGSVYAASDDPKTADLGSTLSGMGPVTDTAGACDSLRSVIRIPAVGLLLAAGVVLVAAFIRYSKPRGGHR